MECGRVGSEELGAAFGLEGSAHVRHSIELTSIRVYYITLVIYLYRKK
jgi:hypothetical protein